MSFVFIDAVNDAIVIHRDLYGKRSLIIQAWQSNDGDDDFCELILSSFQFLDKNSVAMCEIPAGSLLVLKNGQL